MAAPFLPQPPRADRHRQGDSREVLDYQWQFFKALAIDAVVLIRANEFAEPPPLDPASLPAPTATTVAQAQQTANAAFLLAQVVLDSLRAGSVTIAGASASAAVTFATPLQDNLYRVTITRTGATGSPAAGSDDVATIVKTAAGFTVTMKAAPGVGTSVLLDFLVIR